MEATTKLGILAKAGGKSPLPWIGLNKAKMAWNGLRTAPKTPWGWIVDLAMPFCKLKPSKKWVKVVPGISRPSSSRLMVAIRMSSIFTSGLSSRYSSSVLSKTSAKAVKSKESSFKTGRKKKRGQEQKISLWSSYSSFRFRHAIFNLAVHVLWCRHWRY